jgi:hypothetical protein
MWINGIYELPATQNFGAFGGNGLVITIRRTETGVELLESSIHTTWRRQQISYENGVRNLPVVLVQEFE